MGNETKKAFSRRAEAGYFDEYLCGYGIDVGCGTDKLSVPCNEEVIGWDLAQGDAQLMQSIADNTFDFVYSSHCLEHMRNPVEALKNWMRIVKPGGFVFCAVPDEDLYEQRSWPSRYNGDHKTTWTIFKPVGESWSPVSVNVETLPHHVPGCKLLWAKLVDTNYDYSKQYQNIDQSGGDTEIAIEFVLQKDL